jgi:hypothetical protein
VQSIENNLGKQLTMTIHENSVDIKEKE